MDDRQWVVYLVQCADNSLYCGVTNSIEQRMEAHNAGTGAKYTKSRRPVELVRTSVRMSKRDAYKLEYKIKRMPASRKLSALTAAR